MNISSIKNGAVLLGGATLAGAVLGGGIGAVNALKHEGFGGGITRQEKRDALANAIIGGAMGLASGAAVLGVRHVFPGLNNLPIIGSNSLLLLSAGVGAGSAALGMGTLMHHAFN